MAPCCESVVTRRASRIHLRTGHVGGGQRRLSPGPQQQSQNVKACVIKRLRFVVSVPAVALSLTLAPAAFAAGHGGGGFAGHGGGFGGHLGIFGGANGGFEGEG